MTATTRDTTNQIRRAVLAVVLLVGVVGYSVSPAAAATGSVQFSLASTSVDEDAPSFTIEVVRSKTIDAVSVDYVVSGLNDNGSGGRDFTVDLGTATGTVNFATGQATADLTVTLSDDVNGEGGTESFTFTLLNPINIDTPLDLYTIGAQATHGLDITDDGDAGSIVFSTSASSVNETDVGTTNHNISVTRTNGSEGAVTGRIRTITGGDATAGVDFGPVNTLLVWGDGSAVVKQVAVSIVNDNTVENDEEVDLAVTNTSGGASIGANSTHTVTIIDDDSAGVISYAATAASPGEADGTVTLTLERTGGSDGTISASYVTVSGTATGGSDYTSGSDTINFGPGETSKNFAIAILDDLADDDGEQFTVAISGDVTGLTTATISIVDNDDPLEAVDDSFTTPEDTTLVTPNSVLDNDTGPFGVTLSVQSFGSPTSGVLIATDLAAGTFTFDPAVNFEGDVFLSYVLTDGFGTSNGDIRIVVTDDNAAPVAVADVFALISRVTATELDVLANDSDQDGDAVTITTTVLTTAAGNAVDCTSSIQCTFTPLNGFVGSDSFTYGIEDTSNVSATAVASVFVGTPRDCDFNTTAGVAFVGTAGDDVICGSAGNDIIDGGGGDDYILGNGGDDILIGGAGRDLLAGGAGDDILRPGAGDNDDSLGGEGIDTVEYLGTDPGGSAVATGADTVIVNESSITIDTVNDTAVPSEGTDDADSHEGVEKVTIDLLGGNDILTVSPSSTVSFELLGGAGTDRLKYDVTGINGVTDSGAVITATGQQPVAHSSFEIRELDTFIREGTSGVDIWFINSQPLIEGLILDQRESGDQLTVQFGALTGSLAANDTGVFGDDSLIALGESGVDNFEVRSRAVRTADETVTFSGFEVLTVQGRNGDDTFTIRLDAAFRADALELDLLLDGGSGVDVLHLTSDELCSVDDQGRVIISGIGFFSIINIETMIYSCGAKSGVTSFVDGYWLVGSDGNVYPIGNVADFGDRANPDAPVAGIEALVDRQGYWVAQADGNVAAFGAANDHGDLPDLGITPRSPVVDMAALIDGSGYYLLGADGGIFAFDAPFFGSTGNLELALPVAAMATSSNGGYWFVANDGGIFAYGPGAGFFGSVPEFVAYGDLRADIVGMAATSSGNGYWLVAADGGLFAFGDAVFYGSVPGAIGPGVPLAAPIVGIVATATGNGYYIVGADGGVFAFGDAPFLGNFAVPSNNIVALAG